MVCWQMLMKRGANGSVYKVEQQGKGMDREASGGELTASIF
jgi:hypothetical protein